MMRRVCFVCVGFALPAAVLAGQQPTPPAVVSPACVALVELVRQAATPDVRQERATELVNMNLHPRCFAEIVLRGATQRDAFVRFLRALESRRTDKQAGSSAGTGGSTNLVGKGITARILSLAAEYGAPTASVNQQVATVQGSLDGVPAMLVRQRLLPYCPTGAASPDCVNHSVFDTLRRVSYSFSFDMSAASQQVAGTASGAPDGTAQPVTFTAIGRSLTGASVRVALVNSRDATSPAFQAAWLDAVKRESSATLLGEAAGTLLTALEALIKPLLGDPDYRRWQEETIATLVRANAGELDAVWMDRERTLAAVVERVNPSLIERAAEFSRASAVYRFEQDELVRAVADKPVLALEQEYRRPNEQPTTWTTRVMFDKGFGDRWSITANGAVEVYGEEPPAEIPGAKRVRDAQVGVALQRDLGKVPLIGAAALSGAYYFQYQNSPAILTVTPGSPLAGLTLTGLPSSAEFVFVEKGSLHVAQLRLVLGLGSSSARIPIAVSYSNRTELIAKRVLRAQFGVSYDFDSLFAR
jgi:hypothetical protein